MSPCLRAVSRVGVSTNRLCVSLPAPGDKPSRRDSGRAGWDGSLPVSWRRVSGCSRSKRLQPKQSQIPLEMGSYIGVSIVNFVRLGIRRFLGSRASACTSQDLSFLICAMGGPEGEEAAGAFQEPFSLAFCDSLTT